MQQPVGRMSPRRCHTVARPLRYHEAELLHARWAMLAAVGCLVPEVSERPRARLACLAAGGPACS